MLEVGGYYQLPYSDFIFLQVMAQWYPVMDPCQGTSGPSEFTSTGFVFYFGGTPQCFCLSNAEQFDFSSIIPADAERVRIALGVISFCRTFASCTWLNNTSPWVNDVRFGVYPVSSTGAEPAEPRPSPRPRLGPAFPNPVSFGVTTIPFALPREDQARIDVFEISGRLIRTIFEGPATEGWNQTTWDGTDSAGRRVSTGVYFYRLTTTEGSVAGKLIVIAK